MANQTPEESKAAADKAAAELKVAAVVLAEEEKKHVTMHNPKYGNARVHPTTVKSHQDAGWVLVGP